MSRHVLEQPTKADEPPPQPLIVVGSHDWDNWGAVGDAIAKVAEAHPNLMVITSGCPTGAEWYAVQYAIGQNWPHYKMRDEEQLRVENAIVLGFVKNKSNVATSHIGRLSTRFWTRVLREETIRQTTGWEDR